MIPQIQSHPSPRIWDGSGGILDETAATILDERSRALDSDRGPRGPIVAGLTPDFWLKADAIAGKSDGDDVTDWTDSSNNGQDGIAFPIDSVHTFLPSYHTGIQNGLPGVLFTGDSPITSGKGAGMSTGYRRDTDQPFTVFCVCKLNDLANGNRRLLNNGVTGGTNANWLVGPYTGCWRAYDSNFISDGGLDLQPTLLTLSQQTDEAKFYVNEVLIGTDTLTVTNWPGFFGLGCTNVHENFGGYLFEVIAWSRILSNTERNNVSGYLRNKWGF